MRPLIGSRQHRRSSRRRLRCNRKRCRWMSDGQPKDDAIGQPRRGSRPRPGWRALSSEARERGGRAAVGCHDARDDAGKMRRPCHCPIITFNRRWTTAFGERPSRCGFATRHLSELSPKKREHRARRRLFEDGASRLLPSGSIPAPKATVPHYRFLVPVVWCDVGQANPSPSGLCASADQADSFPLILENIESI